MADQFSVKPLGGLDIGTKLTQVIEGGKKQYRIKQMQEKAPEVFESEDPSRIAKFMLEYPEMSQTMQTAIGAQDELQMQEAADVAKSILSPGSDPKEILAQYIIKLKNSDRDASKPTAALAKIIEDPTQEESIGKKLWAISDSQGFLDYQKATAPSAIDKVAAKQKTGSFLVRDESGRQAIATGVFDTESGTLKTEIAGIIPGYQVVSPIGETAIEQTQRRIYESGGKKTAEGVEKRASGLIERGILAAESTAVLRRGIDLLDRVETGGIDAVSLAAKRFFGVEGADEGELSNNLAKAVLSQLKATFGAQFTVQEVSRLERIEAGFTKSSANNKRLLKQALRMAERTANRAKKAAKKRGDDDTVIDIDDLLSFSFGDPTQQDVPTVTTQAGTRTGMSAEQLKAELAKISQMGAQ